MEKALKSDRHVVGICLILAALIFYVDILLPLGVAAGVPYVGVILISLFTPRKKLTLYMTILCTCLIILGHFDSPSGGVHWIALVNRLLALFATWITAWVGNGRRRALDKVSTQKETLENLNKKLAAKISELDEFTYVASHDLQEPVRKLTSFSALLKKDLGKELPENVAKDIYYIEDAAVRMQTLIKDLLDLSRSGRTDMIRITIPVAECVDSAVYALDDLITLSNAKIVCENTLPNVLGDKTMLTQLYQNLIGNAIKFSEGGNPIIHITSERLEQRPGFVLGVKDNGIGIKPEYTEQIFSPFKRLHGRGEFPGSGIGLSICKKVVERHGGHIWVDSAPGKGSHFKFTLGK